MYYVSTDCPYLHNIQLIYCAIKRTPQFYGVRFKRQPTIRLTRQHYSLYVQPKLQFQAVLVFPEYRGVFGDLYSKVSLHL
ncbi:hypothetical protein DL346_14300 [Paenibacillus montanisoli]|uniref:Uncharacterized protein n=1 Tax=Paenibacillus montanisoli TaxID=2081970 RepID=A0A328U8S5_9BACL|nr:hypothetical protein DL346_14300 [Paenibacillus montanisoli]